MNPSAMRKEMSAARPSNVPVEAPSSKSTALPGARCEACGVREGDRDELGVGSIVSVALGVNAADTVVLGVP
ncbi:MAG: hypothetical protein EOO41_02100, partial [Methanobacteriota archaeon]